MVQLPGEQSHKTKQNFLTHIITRSQLLRNTKKHPSRPPPPPPQPPKKSVASVKFIQVSETLFMSISNPLSLLWYIANGDKEGDIWTDNSQSIETEILATN